MFKAIKPKTHLMIDLCLFTLLLTAAISTLLEHTAPQEAEHLRDMLHHAHGITGIAMLVVIGVHLALHLPWIRAQLGRLSR
jgi:hypothetical protein